MCSRCDGFLERRRINSTYEYRDLVRQILAKLKEGTFRLASERVLWKKFLPPGGGQQTPSPTFSNARRAPADTASKSRHITAPAVHGRSRHPFLSPSNRSSPQ